MHSIAVERVVFVGATVSTQMTHFLRQGTLQSSIQLSRAPSRQPPTRSNPVAKLV